MTKTAFVTGAGRRVGRATALELAANGYSVALHYHRSRPEAESVAEECRQKGVEAFVVRGNLADPTACAGLVAEVGLRFEKLDVLVNNASVYEGGAFDQITIEEWDRVLAINVRAPFLLAQGLLPQLRAAAGSGSSSLVVHLCDIGADRPFRGFTHYSVSKAGLVMLVKSMAVELAPEVRTVGIAPGHVAWPEGWDDEKKARMAARIPMRDAGTPEDVARLVRFLAEEGRYVNGEIIAVDGGLAARY